MKPTSSSPCARLASKPPSVPVAQEPPIPVIQPQKAPKVLSEWALQKQQQRQQLLAQAEELSQQHPGLNPQCAYEILAGRYTLDEWRARRQKKQAHFQARSEEGRSEEEKAWFRPFLAQELEREPVWLETARGDQIARIRRWSIYQGILDFPNGSRRVADKRELSALCSAKFSPQVLLMRQAGPEFKRNALPAVKPKERWLFPEQTFAGWVGQQVQVQLLNGSIWTGYLRWNSLYTFLLGAQPTGDSEVMLFKHACCHVQLVPSPARL